MSFIMLTESQVSPPPVSRVKTSPEDTLKAKSKSKRQSKVDTLDATADGDRAISYHAERATRLFEIISARSDVDHPICTECTELLVEGLQRRLSIATKERDAYIDFLRNINSSIPSEEEVQAAQKSVKEAQGSEAAAFDELLAMEKETASAEEEVVALEAEVRELDIEEEEFWRSRNEFALTLAEFQNERDALNMKYDHDARQLEKLQRTNVYNDTFCIGHDGTFGTINGLRLGRLANPSVEWAEINAAWGQTCLLLSTVAEKLGFQFQGYKLRPLGSSSRIEKIEYPQTSPSNSTHTPSSAQQPQPPPQPKITTLDLFSSGDIPILTGLWLHRRFDAGMMAFIDCVAQLGAHVEATSRPPHSANTPGTGLKLPYDIKKDKVGDASIKLGFNQDEIWTRACKYTLTCCKFLLAHASNIASSGGGRR
jgi:beclin 1